MPRKILLSLGALAALLALAVAALFLFLDVDALKPRIEQAVSDQLGRSLRIDGPLELSVLPRIAIALPRTTLSAQGSERPFASVDSARIDLALLPLLSGRIEAGRVRIAGLSATVERGADGRSNIDDLLGRDRSAGAPSGAAAGPAPAFAISDVELSDAALTLIDAGRPAVKLSGLALSVGALAPRSTVPVTLTTRFDAAQAGAQGRLTLSGDLLLDLPAKAFGLRALQVKLQGERAGAGFDLTLALAELRYADTLSADGLKLTLASAGPSAATSLPRLGVEADGLSGTPEQLVLKAVRLNAEFQPAGRRLVASLAGPGRVTLAGPKQGLGLQLKGRFDDSPVGLDLELAGFTSPRLQFELQADRLNLDHVLPAAAGPAPGGAAREAKLDLSALRGLQLGGRLQLGQLQVAGLQASDVRLTAKAAAGRLDLAPLAARLYGGTLAGQAFAVAAGNRLGLAATLTGVSVEALLRDAVGTDLLAGDGNLRVNLRTGGATVAAARRGLAGDASLQLRNGAIKGVDLVRQLRQAQAMLRGGVSEAQRTDPAQRTDFSELSASVVVRDGVAHNEDLAAKSPLLRLAGRGDVDLVAARVDYTAQVSVVGTLRGQDGRDLDELRGVTLPVRLTGPFDQMRYRIDWSAAAKEALKSKATEALKDKLLPKGVDEPAVDALRKLFKR